MRKRWKQFTPISARQRITLFAGSKTHASWREVCECQDWDPNDRAIRLREISQAVGRIVKSSNELNATSDMDKVFAHFNMLAERISADREDSGERRRLLHNIREDCEVLGGELKVFGGWVGRDRFKLFEGFRNLEDLSTKHLRECLITVHRLAVEAARKSDDTLSIQDTGNPTLQPETVQPETRPF